jgi:hypothetical protein
MPESSELYKTIKSALIISSYSTAIISPIRTSIHFDRINYPSRRILQGELFSSLSDLCRAMSSRASRSIDRAITNTKGAIAESGFSVEIIGKLCNIAVIKK